MLPPSNFYRPLCKNINFRQGSGDQKSVPNITPAFLDQVGKISPILKRLRDEVAGPMMARPPYSLGYPSEQAQSAYYPSEERISREEIAIVSEALERCSIYPENTRIRKVYSPDTSTFEVLQASAEAEGYAKELLLPDSKGTVRIVRGDHSRELESICTSLAEASKFAANDGQKTLLAQYGESFRTGSSHVYRDSQRTWIKDKCPRVENIFGFVEPYRDPFGIRAEFEGLVAISDVEETRKLNSIVEMSDKFIKRLPWAVPESLENGGKGPFEKALFDPPDLMSIHCMIDDYFDDMF